MQRKNVKWWQIFRWSSIEFHQWSGADDAQQLIGRYWLCNACRYCTLSYCQMLTSRAQTYDLSYKLLLNALSNDANNQPVARLMRKDIWKEIVYRTGRSKQLKNRIRRRWCGYGMFSPHLNILGSSL